MKLFKILTLSILAISSFNLSAAEAERKDAGEQIVTLDGAIIENYAEKPELFTRKNWEKLFAELDKRSLQDLVEIFCSINRTELSDANLAKIKALEPQKVARIAAMMENEVKQMRISIETSEAEIKARIANGVYVGDGFSVGIYNTESKIRYFKTIIAKLKSA